MAFVQLLVTGDATDEVQLESTLDLTGDVTVSGAGKFLTANDFSVGPNTTLTISTGDVTITGSHHEIDGGGSGADLDGMSAGRDGQILFIRPQDTAETIVVKHNQHAAATNNILLDGDTDYSMDEIDDYMFLIYDVNLDTNGAWIEVTRGISNVATLTANAPASVDITANIAVGSGTEAAKDDHVHDLANGSIEAAALFASGVVDVNAMGANSVGNSEIINTANDIAFNQIILTPNSNGTGTATGTIYYDTEDARLFVFQA